MSRDRPSWEILGNPRKPWRHLAKDCRLAEDVFHAHK